MPRLPETIQVRMGDGTERTWEVRDVGTCKDDRRTGRKGCGAAIFFCMTHLQRWGVADAEAEDDGTYVAHQARCPMIERQSSRRPSAGDAPRRDIYG